jgi:hypothetical protein
MPLSEEEAATKAMRTKAILNVCTDDWYGLWEIRDEAATALQREPDAALRAAIRDQLARMMGGSPASVAVVGRAAAAVIHRLPEESSDRFRPVESPGITEADEQIRVTSTDAGDRAYFGTA